MLYYPDKHNTWTLYVCHLGFLFVHVASQQPHVVLTQTAQHTNTNNEGQQRENLRNKRKKKQKKT